MGPTQNGQRSAKAAPTLSAVLTTQDVTTMIVQAVADFKEEFTGVVNTSTRELVQSQFAEFQWITDKTGVPHVPVGGSQAAAAAGGGGC